MQLHDRLLIDGHRADTVYTARRRLIPRRLRPDPLPRSVTKNFTVIVNADPHTELGSTFCSPCAWIGLHSKTVGRALGRVQRGPAGGGDIRGQIRGRIATWRLGSTLSQLPIKVKYIIDTYNF